MPPAASGESEASANFEAIITRSRIGLNALPNNSPLSCGGCTVNLGRAEKCISHIDGIGHGPGHLPYVCWSAVGMAHAHAAESNGETRDRLALNSVFHIFFICETIAI